MENQPTKKNLQAIKYKLYLANQGYDLLDRKHKVLFRQLVSLKNTTKQLKKQLILHIKASKKLIFDAKVEIGEEKLKKICRKAAINTGEKPSYSLFEGTLALDAAFFEWQKVKSLLQKLSELVTVTNCIEIVMKKTKKRASALENITIPNYRAQIKYISTQLEERERDELARVKLVVTKK